ncbi:hypothetical protein HanRHA438_Chr10g0464421 [Helianthus annuus]|nr:hypothetical protein HanRHA438_Chr10g0464421 [Helianthus annuus]
MYLWRSTWRPATCFGLISRMALEIKRFMFGDLKATIQSRWCHDSLGNPKRLDSQYHLDFLGNLVVSLHSHHSPIPLGN